MSAPNRKLALKWLREGIEAVRPHQLIRQHLRLAGEVLHIRDRQIFLKDYRTIRLAGAGKASAAMGVCLEQILGERISDSLIITKYDHTPNDAGNLNIRESGHPVPDQNSLAAGEALLAFAEKSQPDDLVINLISGGGSALMEALPPGVSLADLQQLSRAMLGAGIPIKAINTVRKHLSRIKGGQL
ncbi:MAG: glycerate-2-kinase family protein, partial [Calditrichaeota bacterium]|nr:glycerate-2-kinase family protein [Calditrichota bacterium]